MGKSLRILAGVTAVALTAFTALVTTPAVFGMDDSGLVLI